MTRTVLAILGLALGASPAFAEGTQVKVGHNRLEPAEVTVSAGSAVTFVNEDQMPGGHSIAADDGSFQSPGLGKGEAWSHTFDEVGAHPYSIKEHPKARGTVIVE